MAITGFKKAVFSGLFLVGSFLAQAQQKPGFKLQDGDLLFQDLDCGPLCDAIEKVTQGHNGSAFSHVGMVTFDKNKQAFVIEAIGDSVQLTPVQKFLNRNLDKAGKPKVAVGRLHKKYRNLIPTAISEACKYRGAPYDVAFAFSNDSYYCSEIIYLAFEKANRQLPLFHLAPMTYVDPETGQLMQPWVEYFNKLQIRLPEGDPGLNPGGMSRSEVLEMYYPYGQPDKRPL